MEHVVGVEPQTLISAILVLKDQ